MRIGFRATVWIGPRTETAVSVYSLAVNPKTVKFANGEQVSSTDIEKWMETELLATLERLKNKPEVTK